MSPAWHIDAWDQRAGRGFVTFRTPDMRTADGLEGGSHFVGPPDFVPEYVASRAIAFSAARGYFTLGLVDGEGEEIGFPSLAAAVDFIRRGYLRGSGEDGPPPGPGGGPPGFPSAPEAIPPFEPEDGGSFRMFARDLGERADDTVRSLADNFIAFAQRPAHIRRDSPASVSWQFDTYGDPAAGVHLADCIASGALRIALEQVRVIDWRGKTDAEIRHSNRLARLGRIIVRAGLARPFSELASVQPGLDVWLAERLWGASDPDRLDEDRITELLLPYLLTGGSASGLVDTYGFADFQSSPLRSDLFFLEPVESDPVELLALLSLPDSVAELLEPRGRRPGQATLFHFLYAALASPQLLGSDPLSDNRLDMLLLAALCITQPALEHGQAPLNFRENAALRRGLACERAHAWLIASLPRFAFAEELEQMIAGGQGNRSAEPA